MSEGAIEVCLPKLGESILSATIVQWLKKEGEAVSLDEPLVEVATDKVNSEIPSPVRGTLTKILAKPGEHVEIGAVLAEMVALVTQGPAHQQAVVKSSETKQPCPAASGEKGGREEFFSPAVLRLARERGLSLEEVASIKGSGAKGRVTKQDLERHLLVKTKKDEGLPDRIPMTPMRKAIAENMVQSFYQAPHAYLMTEIDVTDRLRLIREEREAFFAHHGAKLTITAYLIQAMVAMVKQYPLLNSSLEDDTIVVKREMNVGIAVAIKEGVVVPILKGCEGRELSSLAKGLADLSARARQGKLQPDEVTGGSLTLTNFGMSGALVGLPIIRYPEVAIIGVGAIQKKVVVRDDDSMAIRQIACATLSLDHRVLDGMYAGAALRAFKEAVEAI